MYLQLYYQGSDALRDPGFGSQHTILAPFVCFYEAGYCSCHSHQERYDGSHQTQADLASVPDCADPDPCSVYPDLAQT